MGKLTQVQFEIRAVFEEIWYVFHFREFGSNIFYSLKKRIGRGLERDKSPLLMSECLGSLVCRIKYSTPKP